MKAVRFHQHGGPEVLRYEDAPDPVLKPGEALVRIEAAGVNFIDIYKRRGLYKLTSRIFTSNAASRAVHRAAGFVEVGVQRRHGRLDGEWKDCVLVERLLGEAVDGRS